MSKIPHLSSAIAIISNPFKHLFHNRGSYGINFYMTLLSCCPASHYLIPNWDTSWSHAELTFSLESPFYILGSIIIFEFCLTTENHEEKFLIRIVGKGGSVRTNLYQHPLVHHINNRSQIPCISRKSIRCPSKYSIVFLFS